MTARDLNLETLLDLDGEKFVMAGGKFWTKFEVKRVTSTPERPHGLDYALTLHDTNGFRIFGFDNAHPIMESSGPGARTRIAYDRRTSAL